MRREKLIKIRYEDEDIDESGKPALFTTGQPKLNDFVRSPWPLPPPKSW